MSGGSAGADLVKVHAVRAGGSADAGHTTARAMAEFGTDLSGRLPGAGDLVCSPWSAMVALAMAGVGARGETAAQLDRTLHAPRASVDPGLCWLEQRLEDRTGARKNASGKSGTVSLVSANSLWGQRGVSWHRPFLRTLAGDFGAGMHVVDYRSDPAAAAAAINTWAAARTHDRIKGLVAPAALDASTRLVLVNAIWFKAPWYQAFEENRTHRADFHRPGKGSSRVEMMSAELTATGYAAGDGWQAVRIPYAGNELAMTVVVPDAVDGLPAVERTLAGDGLARLLGQLQRAPVTLDLPRWTTRTDSDLTAALADLGMPIAFTPRADFSGMTSQERLSIRAVLQQAFIAVDEQGTEASAATAVTMRATAIAATPHRVVADRPFWYVLHDVPTGTPLFLGRVTDPG